MKLLLLIAFYTPSLIALVGLGYFFMLKDHKAAGVRVYFYFLLMVILKSIFYIVSPYIIPRLYEHSELLYGPPIAFVMYALTYIMIDELIRKKKTKQLYVHLHLIPTYILSIWFIYTYINPEFTKKHYAIYNLIRVVIAFISALFYYIFLVFKRSKHLKRNNENFKLVIFLLLCLQTVWIYYLFWFVFYKYTIDLYVLNNLIIIRIIEGAASFAIYMSLFNMYKKELLKTRNERGRILPTFTHLHFPELEQEFVIKESDETTNNKQISDLKINHTQIEDLDKSSDKLKEMSLLVHDFFSENKEIVLDSSFNLSTLEQHLEVSKYQLNKIFNEYLKTNFTKYLNEYRINHACSLLKQGMSVTEVSFSCGYRSRTSFYNNFKKVMGVSVMEYKEG